MWWHQCLCSNLNELSCAMIGCREMSINHRFCMSCRLIKQHEWKHLSVVQWGCYTWVWIAVLNSSLCVLDHFPHQRRLSPSSCGSAGNVCIDTIFMQQCLQLIEVWLFFYLNNKILYVCCDIYKPTEEDMLSTGKRRYRYSSWDVPIQGTSLKKILLSWSVDRRQSRKIGQ